MLESVKKLRDVATDLGMPVVYLLQDAYNSYSATSALLVACDEIEREVSERYIPLPLDADGVPIHVGDELHDSISNSDVIVIAVGNGRAFYCDDNANYRKVFTDNCRHVKADPVKELLSRVADEVYDDSHETPFDRDFIVEKYANELRNTFSGDA